MNDVVNTPTAAEAHHEAFVAHSKTITNHDAAAAELVDAQAARDALLARAADGAAVGPSDIRQAEDAIRDSEAAVILAKAVEQGARRRMFKLEVPALADKAAVHQAAVVDATKAFFDISAECDSDLAALRVKLASRDDAHVALGRVIMGARQHNQQLAKRAKVNETLMRQHESVHPKTRVEVEYQIDAPLQAHFTTYNPLGMVQGAVPYTMADRARWTYGRLLPAGVA
jgi:hypothetical protein